MIYSVNPIPSKFPRSSFSELEIIIQEPTRGPKRWGRAKATPHESFLGPEPRLSHRGRVTPRQPSTFGKTALWTVFSWFVCLPVAVINHPGQEKLRGEKAYCSSELHWSHWTHCQQTEWDKYMLLLSFCSPFLCSKAPAREIRAPPQWASPPTLINTIKILPQGQGQRPIFQVTLGPVMLIILTATQRNIME